MQLHQAYGSNWNRLPGGAPDWYSNNFKRGTEKSVQTFRILIRSVGAQSLLDSHATFTQLIFLSQEQTFTVLLAGSSSSV